MKLLFMHLFACISIFTASAQDLPGKNSFSLNIGAAHLIRQDLIFSPFIHSDLNATNIGLDYTREAKLYHKISLRYSNFQAMVADPYEFSVHQKTEPAYPHSFNFIELDYLLGKQVRLKDNSSLIVGGVLAADVQVMNYAYGRISSFGYYSTLGLGLFADYAIAISEKNRLSAVIQLPLVQWLARPPYIGIDDEFIENISSHSSFKTFMAFIGDGKFNTWNTVQNVDLSVKYSYSINVKWNVGASYMFEYIHSSQPRNLLSFRNTLNLFTTINF